MGVTENLLGLQGLLTQVAPQEPQANEDELGSGLASGAHQKDGQQHSALRADVLLAISSWEKCGPIHSTE